MTPTQSMTIFLDLLVLLFSLKPPNMTFMIVHNENPQLRSWIFSISGWGKKTIMKIVTAALTLY